MSKIHIRLDDIGSSLARTPHTFSHNFEEILCGYKKARLKSKTGCLTCVARKKKCDEVSPQCGNCKRLDLSCRRRNDVESSKYCILSTNLRSTLPSLTPAISSGFPPFRNDVERSVTLESPKILSSLVSRMASPAFIEVKLLGRLCAQSRLVRDSMVAFTALGQINGSGHLYKICLKNYQSCIVTLRQMPAQQLISKGKDCYVLVALCFLGLLEVSFDTILSSEQT